MEEVGASMCIWTQTHLGEGHWSTCCHFKGIPMWPICTVGGGATLSGRTLPPCRKDCRLQDPLTSLSSVVSLSTRLRRATACLRPRTRPIACMPWCSSAGSTIRRKDQTLRLFTPCSSVPWNPHELSCCELYSRRLSCYSRRLSCLDVHQSCVFP